MARAPGPAQRLVMRHHELIKFALVGGTTMVIDMAIFYGLVWTVLEQKPVVAKIISGVVATIASYILNREWAFKHRGGREMHHEALLFFVISGIGVVLQAAPIFVANNVFSSREHLSLTATAILDFFLNYIVGNLLQMAFRFWALRKFAFPDEHLHTGPQVAPVDDLSDEELEDRELGHG